MKANKEFRDEKVKCINCNKEYNPRYSSKGKYCSNKCQGEHTSRTKYEEYLKDQTPYYGKMNTRWLKKYILEEQGRKCKICGNCTSWNGRDLILILDHINGNANDNSRENLRLICPNCDSQLDTYKSKNKNGARHYYRYKK